jgi:hypothetical protein
MLLVRLLSSLRRHWPQTHILVRGDRHFATPEIIDVIASSRWTDCVFGLASNAVWRRQAAPPIEAARQLHYHRVALAQAHGQAPPPRSRLYDECLSAAGSWAQPWRVGLKAEVMCASDNPRLVVTALDAPTPAMLYEALYGARGNGENESTAVKIDLHSDRTSATTVLATALRLLLACAAYVLHQALRTSTLHHTALAQAQPSTIILTLCKIAAPGKQSQARLLLQLPAFCAMKEDSHWG